MNKICKKVLKYSRKVNKYKIKAVFGVNIWKLSINHVIFAVYYKSSTLILTYNNNRKRI